MRNKPIYLAILLSLASQLVGCDSMQKATANDCKRVYDHGTELLCGNGLFSSVCKAGVGLFSDEKKFISECVRDMTMANVNCALEQNSSTGLEQCLQKK